MTIEEIVIYGIDKFSQPGASSSGLISGLLLIASASLWIKKYIINGSLKKYFDLKEREISSLESVSKKIDTVIDEQRKLLEAAKHE